MREALKLYETLQQIAEEVHGLRNSHAAMAHRAIADVHQLLKEYGELPIYFAKNDLNSHYLSETYLVRMIRG